MGRWVGWVGWVQVGAMQLSRAVSRAFDAHSELLQQLFLQRQQSVSFRNVVDDAEERAVLQLADTLGKRQPSDVFSGDVNLRTLRTLLGMIDERGWERSPHQVLFHASFEKCVSRVLYKNEDEWKTQRPAIMRHNGWERCSSEVMISTPRRFGKTFS